jgi:hypothetical protein
MADRPFEGDPRDLQEQEQLALFNENPEAVLPEISGENAIGSGVAPVEAEVVDENADPDAIPEDWQKALMELVDNYEKSEDEVRSRMLRKWKLMEHFWNDNQHNVWSEVAQDWRSIESYMDEDDLDLEGFEPRTVNIYKAHGESVIAAMAAGVPATKFFPNDADSIDDVSTSKVYSRAAELIQQRNKAPLLLIRSLYILWNQGVVAFYNYSRSDPKLGTVVQPIRGLVEQVNQEAYCPECGNAMVDNVCQTCGYEGEPEVDEVPSMVPGIVGHETITRITEDIRAYSPLFFRIPHRATSQDECAWLTLDTEQSPGAVIAAFKADIPNIRELVSPTRDEERYDRWARNLTNDSGFGESNLVTVRQRWVRSWALEEIEDEAIREGLLAKFPNGVYFIQAGDNFITARDENLDDHWTISQSPTSPHLYAQALGQSLVSIQELTNELVTMTVDNIEHGTPMALVDSDLINLKKYKDSRVVPGAMYPVKVPPGAAIDNFIHETKPSTLSDEVRHFAGELKEFAQFTSGAFPSIYGGVMSGGSGTAKEYEMSRAQALQRLQITWRVVSECWTEMMGKSVKDYLENLRYDERFVKPHGKMGYINVWIRKSEMTGEVGEVIAESSESFPISHSQKRDVLMKLLEMQDPNIGAAIFHPENSGTVASLVGFGEFYIPGDDDRSKQLNEITELLQAQPIPVGMDPMTGQIQFQPTVMPDMDIDDHEIHMQTIKAFLVSETGIQVKRENPMGFQNCLAHYKAHEMGAMLTAMKQGLLGGAGGGTESETPGDDSAPNVDAPQGVESGNA